MTAKNIQDVVAKFRKNYIEPGDVFKDLTAELAVEEYLEHTLTQLVKEVEAGEQDRILQELKDETNNWKETISHYTIEGIVTNWRDYKKVYHEAPTSDVTEK